MRLVMGTNSNKRFRQQKQPFCNDSGLWEQRPKHLLIQKPSTVDGAHGLVDRCRFAPMSQGYMHEQPQPYRSWKPVDQWRHEVRFQRKPVVGSLAEVGRGYPSQVVRESDHTVPIADMLQYGV